MASRSRKGPSATREVSTPQAAASPRVRPPSPIMSSRVQEKQDLANLNDRLASYIDRVRKLESENSRLTKQIEIHEESVTKEVTNIKSIYETELADTRKLLDELAKEKAKLQIDAGKFKSELDEYKDKYLKAAADLKDAERRLLAAEGQVSDLQARVTDAVNQKKHAETELNRLRKEVDSLEKQLAAAKKQLEAETIARVDLENRVQSLKEELAFNRQIHQQELTESRMRTQIEVEEVDARLADEYDSRLADALKDFRNEMDHMVRSTRGETEAYFVQKLEELRGIAEKSDNLKDSAQTETRRLRKEVDELSGTISKLTSLTTQYEKRIKDLEDRLRREQEDHHAAVDARDAEVRRLRDALENQLAEYRDLLDVKIQLDTEIAAYRKLLEAEESRLSISGESTPRPGRATPSRSMTPGASRKRKRGNDEAQYSEAAARYEYTSTSSASGNVEVKEADGEGKFIKLINNDADQDISLAGWQLKQTVGETEVVYKFHRSSNLKAGQHVTVWSSDSGTAASPPSELVMKGTQKWVTGDTMKSVLINADGQEVASREVKRTILRTTFNRTARSIDAVDGGEVGREHIFHEQGDPRRDEKCSVM